MECGAKGYRLTALPHPLKFYKNRQAILPASEVLWSGSGEKVLAKHGTDSFFNSVHLSYGKQKTLPEKGSKKN
jgi:hypothetical protein